MIRGDLFHRLESLKGARILGVNPPVHDFAFFDLWARPLGLLYILQWLRDRGNEVSLVDCIAEAPDRDRGFGRSTVIRKEIPRPDVFRKIPRRYFHFGLDEKDFRQRLEEIPEPDVILLTSGMTYWYTGVFWAIRILREAFPGTPVYLGGIYARLCPEHAFRAGADAVQTEPFPVLAPYPAMDLYESPRYGVGVTSWGCPLGCDYCASGKLFPSYRRRSVEELLEEIRFQVRTCCVRQFSFYDDALLLQKKEYFYPLCMEIRTRFPGLKLHTPNGLHVRSIDSECAHVLREAGVTTLRLSLESVDPEILKESSFKTSRDEYRLALNNLRDAGYRSEDLETYVLVGLPGQSLEGVRETISFIRDLGGRPKLAQFSPIPGTKIFPMAQRAVPELEEEPLLQNNTVFSTYVSGFLAPQTLQELKHLAYRGVAHDRESGSVMK